MRCMMISAALLIAGSLAACNSSDGQSNGDTDYVEPVNYAGKYTSSGNCQALTGSLTVSQSSFRISEIVCNIDDIRGLNTSATEYALSGCLSEGTPVSDRSVKISEIEDGMVELSGWSDRGVVFESCR